MVKNRPANVGDAGSIPGSGRSPGEINGNPLPYSCLGSPMNRGAFLPYLFFNFFSWIQDLTVIF